MEHFSYINSNKESVVEIYLNIPAQLGRTTMLSALNEYFGNLKIKTISVLPANEKIL